MRIVILFSTLMLAAALLASAQDSPTQSTAGSTSSTLTGCLKGSTDQYYLVEKDGSRYTLMAKGQDLQSTT